MNRLLALIAPVIFSLTAFADDPITKPIRYTWIATSSSWNQAAAEMVLANGDKHVIILPTGNTERPWLILRRVEEGSIFVPEDEPFTCEVFDTVPAATAHFSAMDGCHTPMILNVPDGRAVIASLQKCGKSGNATLDQTTP